MSIEEPTVRLRLRRKLEELVGVEEADVLLDRPPGGWSALVTNETLDLKLEAFEARLQSRIDRGFSVQTWRLVAAMAAFAGVLVAAVRL